MNVDAVYVINNSRSNTPAKQVGFYGGRFVAFDNDELTSNQRNALYFLIIN